MKHALDHASDQASNHAFVETGKRQSALRELALAHGPAIDPALTLGKRLVGTRIAGSTDETSLITFIPGSIGGITLVSLHGQYSQIAAPGRGRRRFDEGRRRGRRLAVERGQVGGRSAPVGHGSMRERGATPSFLAPSFPAVHAHFGIRTMPDMALHAYASKTGGYSMMTTTLPFVGWWPSQPASQPPSRPPSWRAA